MSSMLPGVTLGELPVDERPGSTTCWHPCCLMPSPDLDAVDAEIVPWRVWDTRGCSVPPRSSVPSVVVQSVDPRSLFYIHVDRETSSTPCTGPASQPCRDRVWPPSEDGSGGLAECALVQIRIGNGKGNENTAILATY